MKAPFARKTLFSKALVKISMLKVHVLD